MRRFPVVIALVAALAVPSAVVVGLSGASGATTAAASCAKLTAKSGVVTISSCTPKVAGYTSASGSEAALAKGGTLTWSTNKKTTIVGKPTETVVKPDKCSGTGNTEEKAVGKIKGGTATYTPTGQSFTAYVCLKTITLAPGTKATF
jgi:hypothetical protein